ncbi:MAG: dual specificity protein phosphatase family protein [Chloroflexi bacterium]|nr:dual specificity protein phosphatase family protein [Chloroflexota bacterium]
MPFCYFDAENTIFDAYKTAGIDMVVMLTNDEEAQKHSGLNLREFYNEAGMDVLYYPITDFSTPEDREAFSEAVDNAIQQVREGKNIVIHCYAGIGRTGMFAALMVRRILGLEGDDAIKWVRNFVPDAVQTPEQRRIILDNAGK